MRDIEYDFGLVVGAGCKRIILHDYWQSAEDWPDVKGFVDALVEKGFYKQSFGPGIRGFCNHHVRVEIHKPFVLVEAP